jgi:hypothetical protein
MTRKKHRMLNNKQVLEPKIQLEYLVLLRVAYSPFFFSSEKYNCNSSTLAGNSMAAWSSRFKAAAVN